MKVLQVLQGLGYISFTLEKTKVGIQFLKGAKFVLRLLTCRVGK